MPCHCILDTRIGVRRWNGKNLGCNQGMAISCTRVKNLYIIPGEGCLHTPYKHFLPFILGLACNRHPSIYPSNVLRTIAPMFPPMTVGSMLKLLMSKGVNMDGTAPIIDTWAWGNDRNMIPLAGFVTFHPVSFCPGRVITRGR